MQNIIDYLYCRILRILLRMEKNAVFFRIYYHNRAAITLACAFACLTLFIPFNLSYFLFGNETSIIITMVLYMVGVFWFFERRYVKYENDAEERFKFIRKYSSYRMNKLIPDWAIIIGVLLICVFGFCFAFISNNLLIGNEMTLNILHKDFQEVYEDVYSSFWRSSSSYGLLSKISL